MFAAFWSYEINFSGNHDAKELACHPIFDGMLNDNMLCIVAEKFGIGETKSNELAQRG